MRVPLLAVLPVLAVFAALSVRPAQAAPTSVILYPSGAFVSEEYPLTPERGKAVLDLPAALDEASLRFSLAQGTVRGVRLEKVNGGKTGPLAALQTRRQELAARLDAEKAHGEALSALTQSLSSAPFKKGKAENNEGVQARQTRLEDMARQRLASERAAKSLEAELRTLDERLAALGGERDTLRCTLELTADMTAAPTARGLVSVRASYFVPAAGWSPQYEVEALPDQETVRVSLRARLWQNTGRDWNGARVTLASMNAPAGVNPPPLTPPARPLMLQSAMRRSAAAKAAADGFAAESAPAREEQGGKTWDAGELHLADACPLSVPLENCELSASFLRLVRPAASPAAWIQARLKNGDAPFLPAGEAVFLLDGLPVGRDTFSLASADATLAFGRDPLVTVQYNALPARPETAEQDMEQTNLRWNIALANGHSRPVQVRVEEPAPLHRDAAVRIQERSQPAPVLDEEHNAYVWERTLPARGRAVIREDLLILSPRILPPGK